MAVGRDARAGRRDHRARRFRRGGAHHPAGGPRRAGDARRARGGLDARRDGAAAGLHDRAAAPRLQLRAQLQGGADLRVDDRARAELAGDDLELRSAQADGVDVPGAGARPAAAHGRRDEGDGADLGGRRVHRGGGAGGGGDLSGAAGGAPQSRDDAGQRLRVAAGANVIPVGDRRLTLTASPSITCPSQVT